MAEIRPVLGFIGIGLMGQPMVLRLLQAGFVVHVWNRSVDKLQAVTAAGAQRAVTIGEMMAVADVLLLCLTDAVAVRHVVEHAIVPAARADKLVIDLSSIDPVTTRELAAQLAAYKMGWVDAPVSGGVMGAEQGNLAIMAGGTVAQIEVARQVLAPLYRQLTHMGAVGSGQLTKICNQMLVSCNVLVIAEMIALAESAGVDGGKIAEALTGGFADSKPLQILAPEMANRQFEPIKWRVKTLLKDLLMAAELARAQNQSVPMSALAAQLLQLHGRKGYLEQDPSTLIKLYRES